MRTAKLPNLTPATVSAGTLSGTTLSGGVVTSSLTSVGTLTGGATGAGFTLALSTSTVLGVLPSANFPSMLPAVSGALLTALNASNIASGTVPPDALGSGSGGGAVKFLREDSTWQAIAGGGSGGGGDALTANSLSQFASTTSAQLRAVISDEKGTGVLLFDGAVSPTFGGTLGAATVTASGPVTGSNLSGTNTGDNAVNSLYSSLVTNASHTGDATGATVLTLATVNADVGSYGSTTTVPVISVDAKGRVTGVNATAIALPPPSIGSVTGLGSGVGDALTIAVGGQGSAVISGGAGGTPTSITLTNGTGLPVAGVVGLGSLATQSGTFSGASSGTNTGDQDLSGYVTTSAANVAYQPVAAVLTNTTASFTTVLETKLSGIAASATANSSDATLLARANHTGTQSYTTVSGLGSLATQSGTFSGVSTGTNTGDQDLSSYATAAAVAAAYQPLTAALTGTTASFTGALYTKLIGIDTAATANSSDAALLARANHTGTQSYTTIVGLGSLATQSGTFSGTSSGTNTGDQDLSGYATSATVAASYQPLAPTLTNTTASFTTALETKLGGVATSATANSSDATLLARANHTGTQAYTTITGLGSLATQSGTFSGASSGTNTGDQDLSGYLTVATAASTYQPVAAVLTSTTASFTTALETKLGGVSVGATANSSDATLLARANHTGTQSYTTVSGLGSLATQSGTFSGTSSGTNTGDQTSVSGNAGTATVLAAGRTLGITGDITWTSPAFDGSANVTATGTLATVASAGTTGGSTAIPVITINAKGLTTSVTSVAVVAPAGTLTGGTLASGVTASSLLTAGGGTFGTAAFTAAGAYATAASITGGGAVVTGGFTLTLPATGTAVLTGAALGTPASGTLTNCTFPTLNQSTTGSAASLSIAGQTGAVTLTGLASTSRVKTVRDAADTLLELGGNYTPTGTWTSLTLVTPALGTPTAGILTNCTFPTLNQSTTGSAATLTTPRNINGTAFNGSADITVAAAAGTLTGTTLASNVLATSITSTGTLTGGTTGAGFTLSLTASTVTGALPSANFPSTLPALNGSALTALNASAIASGVVPPANLGSGASITTKYLRGDGTWQTLAGGGDAVTTNPLSQFASTTSAQLRGVLSDSNGTGAAIFDGATSPTFGGTLGAATVTASGPVTGSNLSGTNTGDNAVNSLYSSLVTNASHTGDATGATVLTLATVNSNVGSFTNSTVTVNAKGLVTAVSTGTTGMTLGKALVTSLGFNLN